MKYPLVIVLIGLVFSSLATAQQRGQRPANVEAAPLDFAPLQVEIDTVGTAQAIRSVSLYPAVADRVTQVLFTPGEFVKTGQLLLELDARRQHTAVKKAEIELADAERTLKRLQASRKDGAVTQSDLDDAITLRDLAQVTLRDAKADLEDRRVLAPFDGYVGLTDVEPGDRINTSTLITTIDDRRQLFINFDAPEMALNLLHQDTEVLIQPWNNRDVSLHAKLAELDSRIDASDRTLRVRAILDNETDQFRPGLSFKVTLKSDGEAYPDVPEAALAWGATGSYVWLVRDGKAHRVDVAIKQRLRGSILVEGELRPDDILITEGIQRLRQGQEVIYGQLAQLGASQ